MHFTRLALALLVVAAAAQAQGNRRKPNPNRRRPADDVTSCKGDTSFELITGFVYSSADDIIDSKIGTLLLSECMEYCRNNPQCQALNFETGLCVLFKTAAGENSAALAVSQFPVFTLYAQRVCLPKERPVCKSPWAYETVPGLAITQTFTADSRPAASRAECALMCILEEKFQCRAVSYSASTGICTMAQVDRNMAGRKRILDIDEKSDYLEVSCVPKPQKMCDFQSINGRILKTVDAVYQDVESTEECQARCKEAEFTCYSYDFMSASEKICRLSHHSSATLAHIQEPYLEIANATTYEMQSCYQVTVECRGAEMLAKISTSTLFHGKVYAKDRPNSCVMDVKNATEFEILLPYNDVNCDVIQDGPGAFSTNIVIQHHDMIVTSADVGLALHCKYDLKNQTVTNSLTSEIEMRNDVPEFIEETIVESPSVVMRVTSPEGDDLFSAQVGDNMALRFEITEAQSPYEIFVRDLVAMDGQDNSEILLIDSKGCPTDPTIMSAVRQMGSGQILHAPFQAFKFPASEIVQFRALVTPCHPRCEPVQCNVQGFDGVSRREQSYGRKKREVDGDMFLHQSVRVVDNFKFAASREEEVEVDLAQETCSSFTGVIVACALFLAAQLVLLMAWSYLWHKKRATKQIDPTPPPPSLYFGTTSSRASSTSYLTD